MGFLSRRQTEGKALRTPKGNSGDAVVMYFAMRKSSMGRTADGGLRPLLNDEFVFQTGMLDQVAFLSCQKRERGGLKGWRGS